MTTGLIKTKQHPTKDLHLKTYTKRAFFRRAWNDDTINARGHVYDGNGNTIAAPFPKIFNLDEHESTSLKTLLRHTMANMDRMEIHLKYNGHLAIMFHDGEEWLNNTRGSFQHDFIGPDRALIEATGFSDEVLRQTPVNWTLMFEIIGRHDPHLLTESTIDLLGSEMAVLIGVNDRETGMPVASEEYEEFFKSRGCNIPGSFEKLKTYLEVIGVDTTSELDVAEAFQSLLGMKGFEGYIIFDPVDNYRVKLKTHWFVHERYKFQFNHERTKNIFLKHLDTETAFLKIPEELHPGYNRLLDAFEQYCEKSCDNMMTYLQVLFELYKTKHCTIDAIRATENLSDAEKDLLILYLNDDGEYEEKLKNMFVEAVETMSLVELN